MNRLFPLTIAAMWLTSPTMAQDESHQLVIKAPDKHLSSWTIGDEQIELGTDVEIKPSSGRLMPGSCVRIERNEGTIVRVQTRPMVYCDQTDYVAFLNTYSALAE